MTGIDRSTWKLAPSYCLRRVLFIVVVLHAVGNDFMFFKEKIIQMRTFLAKLGIPSYIDPRSQLSCGVLITIFRSVSNSSSAIFTALEQQIVPIQFKNDLMLAAYLPLELLL